MKNLYVIILSLALFCCDNDKKELMATYNDFTKVGDSIAEVHNEFEAKQNAMKAKYEKLRAEFQNMENQDSLLLENLREQGLLIERHDAIMNSHAKVIEAHKTDQPDFKNMDALQLNEKIEEMRKWHERMRKDHNLLKEEHERMENVYINLERSINRDSQ